MNATVAAQMTSADFLKLRKKRGTVIWALVLALAPLLIYFIVRGVQHSSNPRQIRTRRRHSRLQRRRCACSRCSSVRSRRS